MLALVYPWLLLLLVSVEQHVQHRSWATVTGACVGLSRPAPGAQRLTDTLIGTLHSC